MPFTASISEEASPFKLALANAYTVITNIQSMNTVNDDGTAAEPEFTVFTAVYANEAAFKAGGQPGSQNSYKLRTDSPVMPLFEAALAPVLAALPGVTDVTQVEILITPKTSSRQENTMRQIEFKTINQPTLDPRTGSPTEVKFSYLENVLNALRYPKPPAPGQSPQGLDYAELARVIPLIQRLQKAKDGESILFEDAEWATIVDRVKSLQWLAATETAFDFVTYIAGLPEASVTPAKSASKKA